MQDLTRINIKKIGFLVCFHSYKAQHGKYPETPEELRKATSTLLEKRRFKEYKAWFHQFTGEPE